jgi:hypothetical protein
VKEPTHPLQHMHARQLTGTAMLRPAASPWRSFAPRTRAAAASRCININATRSSSEPSLAPQVNVDADSVPAASPGTLSTCYQISTVANIGQTPASRSSARPSRSSPSRCRPRRRSTPAAEHSSASVASRKTRSRPSPSSSPSAAPLSASRSFTRRSRPRAPSQLSSPPSRPYRASSQ